MAEPGATLKDAAAAADLTLLPDDAILVHIGVHKTGTTALQSDLKRSRSTLAQHGLALPRSKVTPLHAGRCLVGGELTWDTKSTRQERMAKWNTFASDVSAERGRVIVSSEFLCQANDKQAKRLVDDLGPSRVYLLVAFRPLETLLPSSWQQHLKSGKHRTYDEWLTDVLADQPPTMRPKTFWKRNDVAVQLGRWSTLLGAERVTAVVIEGGADMKVRRCIEILQGLPPGLLDPPADAARSNRSLTVAEAEMLRQVNIVARKSLSGSEYLRMVRFGAVRQMVEARRPGPEEGRIGLPEWAVPRVKEIGAAAGRRPAGIRRPHRGEP